MNQIWRLLFVTGFFCLQGLSCLTAQNPEQNTLQVAGEVLSPLVVKLEDLAKLPSSVVKVKDRDKKKHRYRGVALYEILKLAGVTLGDQLRGENLAKYVLIQAADGYEVVFSLAEVDPGMTDKVVLLAFEVDGMALPAGQGPFRLVAPGEKRQARWVREIRTIRVEFHQ